VSDKILFAGPWLGEFGWELFCWHAYIRTLSKFYDKTICVSNEHSRFLYEDFCDHFIAFSPEAGGSKDSFYKIGFSITNELIHKQLVESGFNTKDSKVSIFAPRRIGDPPRTHFTESFKFGNNVVVPEYKKYGTPQEKYKDFIAVHARDRLLRANDNWPEKKWALLVDKLKKTGYNNVVSIGLKKESMHIEGTTDMRECEHGVLLDLLASAKCIFGPSSGAMHLASLCGCPQVVWSTDYNFDRYIKNWNPFGAKVAFLSEQGWKPTPEYVFQNFISNFEAQK
tara:strand:- start:5882 stop:6727 length:846 start_codon:yes stop_codon:yes gene_type:complete